MPDDAAKNEEASEPNEPHEARTTAATAIREESSGVARKKLPPPTFGQRVTLRWAAITSVMCVLLLIYTQHPYYLGQQFAPWRPLYTFAFVTWLLFGLLYVRVTLRRFGSTRFMMRDGGLHLLLLGRALLQKRFWRRAKNPRLRTTLLGICVKSFFTPLMTGFFVNHASTLADLWMRHKHLPALRFVMPRGGVLTQATAWWKQLAQRLPDLVPHASDFSGMFSNWTQGDVHFTFDVLYNIIFFVDCGWALIGYSMESRWLGNKTRSVEPTGVGWIACIFCYPPYNNVLGTYLPLETGPQFVSDPTWLLILRGGVIFLFTIYAAATVSFGFKFSNLTNRGVVSRGPYAFVRHPAYLTKCSAWWLEHLPTMTFTKAIFLTGLCGVYALRAWTEERHLGRDPEYRAYKKKVRAVFIPGWF